MTRPSDPTEALVAGARQYVADLSDDEVNALVAETREPDGREGKAGPTPRGGGSGRAQAIAEAKRSGYPTKEV